MSHREKSFLSVALSLHRNFIYKTLPAKTEDIVDIKGGHLSNRVCTVKFPVGEFNISSNTTHTELHYSASAWPEFIYIYFFIHKKCMAFL